MFQLTARLTRVIARLLRPALERDFTDLRREVERLAKSAGRSDERAAESLARLQSAVDGLSADLSRRGERDDRLERTATGTTERLDALVREIQHGLIPRLTEVHDRQLPGDRKILATLAALRAELGALPTRTWLAAQSVPGAGAPPSDEDFAAQLERELASHPDTDWEQRLASLRAVEDGLRADDTARSDTTNRLVACVGRIREAETDRFLRASNPDPRVPIKAALRTVDDKVLRGGLLQSLEVRRERYVEQAIRGRALGWETPLAAESRYGEGFDERVVELPLAWEFLELHRPGRVLDAGAAMNLPVVRRLAAGLQGSIVHVTQSGARELELFDRDRFSYLFDDLRALSLSSATFDRVVCISTLEHVGMDNARYGASEERSRDAFLLALSELLRVTVPGGQLLITVPYGRAETAGWYQVFDAEAIARMVAMPGVSAHRTRLFRYDRGWHDAPVAFDQPASTTADWDQAITGLAVVRMIRG